jgi:hypothetical protein
MPHIVSFYDINNLGTELGGLRSTLGITNADFHSMIKIVPKIEDAGQTRALVQGDYELLKYGDGEILQRDNQELQPGKYIVRPYNSRYNWLNSRTTLA